MIWRFVRLDAERRSRKLQTLALRYNCQLWQVCIDICGDEVEYASTMHGGFSDEH
jgi:hypothetical protein